jgi:hypothetical protein
MAQRKSRMGAGRPARSPLRREFTVAVRYRDGRSEMFRVRNADDIEDARAMVLAEVDDAMAVLVAPHR